MQKLESRCAKGKSELRTNGLTPGRVMDVAQIVNLLYRRLSTGGVAAGLKCRTAGGLPIRDTADCQSALPSGGVEK
jgi:hypothetical protein